MSLLNEIIEGWSNYIFESKEVEEEAKRRMEICISCEQFRKHSKRCRVCGCYMPAKVRSTKSTCPAKKW
jgi:uncharacterized paraquat-inducible protein A